MIRHGPQANYADYARRKGKKPVPSLLLPDVSRRTLLCFDANGEMYLIDNEEDPRITTPARAGNTSRMERTGTQQDSSADRRGKSGKSKKVALTKEDVK